MSLEKAIVFKKFPELLIQLIEQQHNAKINILDIYYKRNDPNLKMKSVVLYIKYDIQNKQ
jgi:hypothetical protein